MIVDVCVKWHGLFWIVGASVIIVRSRGAYFAMVNQGALVLGIVIVPFKHVHLTQPTSVMAVRSAGLSSEIGVDGCSHMYSAVPSAQSSTPSQRLECETTSSLAHMKWLWVHEPVALWQAAEASWLRQTSATAAMRSSFIVL